MIGSGAGLNVAHRAVNDEKRVALLEHGLLGGTCLNTGCVPSKILIYPADVVRVLQDARAVGVEGTIDRVDFPLIMKRMRALVDGGRKDMEEAAREVENLDWYRQTAEFVSDYTLKTADTTITAPSIVIASGARTLVPPIPGLVEAGYLDNVSVFQIDRLPESLVILGGGYIGCELGHFFSSLGTDVTVVGRNPRLLKAEDPEISEAARKAISRYMSVYTNHEVVKVEAKGDKKVVYALDRAGGDTRSFEAEEILLAVGRRPNSDLLKLERTGVKTDKRGWIVVDEYLETTKPGIWAFGDAIGKHMFRHTANYEAQVVWRNAFSEDKVMVDYHAVPHAVFTHPQVAGVGMTEPEAVAGGYEVLVGRSRYTDTAKGYAMAEEDGMVKVVVDGKSGVILGCHIVGTSAPDLVQQVTYLMNAEDQTYIPLARSQVIHPALSEVVVRAFGNLEHPEHHRDLEHHHEHG